jgi:hypothetical protein
MDREYFDSLLERVKQERDELAVRLHLGKAEVREEWDRLEPRWNEMKARAGSLGDESDEVVEDIKAAFGLVAEEMRKGYRRIAESLDGGDDDTGVRAGPDGGDSG